MKKHKYLEEILDLCKWKHLTAEQIYENLKESYKTIWLATVYRSLQVLVKQWKIRKIENIDKTTYYETVARPHIHFIDEDTGEILDIDPDIIEIKKEWFFDKICDIRIIWKIKNDHRKDK